MNNKGFQPFEDRMSRDIRNELSEGLAVAIESGEKDTLEAVKKRYRTQPLAGYYLEYLEDRCSRYDQALAAIFTGNITDPIHRGLILWDLGLFFEMHEVLEHAWYTAQGPMKMTLQALVRAAGVYIKREYGYHDSAARIAGKAVPVLRENHAILVKYFNPEKLILPLCDPDMAPPRLL